MAYNPYTNYVPYVNSILQPQLTPEQIYQNYQQVQSQNPYNSQTQPNMAMNNRGIMLL